MENTAVHRPARKTDNNANRTSYYVTLTFAIAIGLVGVFGRFVPDVLPEFGQNASAFSLMANLLVAVAAVMVFRVVFRILGFGSKVDR